MSYIYVRLNTCYRAALKDFYNKNSFVSTLSYDAHLKQLMSQCYGEADFYEKNLRSLGVDAYTLISNDVVLQNKWAEEHQLKDAHKLDIIIAQLKELKVEVLHVMDFAEVNQTWLTTLKEQIPSLKLILGFCCAPYSEETLKLFSYCDCVIICSDAFKMPLEKKGIQTFEINHGFETSLLKLIPSVTQEIDISFIGSIVSGKNFHHQRKEILEALVAQNVKFDFYGNIATYPLWKGIAWDALHPICKTLRCIDFLNLTSNKDSINKIIYGSRPESMIVSKGLYQNLRTPVFGIEMYRLLAKTKISLNTHGDIVPLHAANMRLFEATGVGSCLLTDWKPNIEKFFKDGEECVTYKTADECVQKIKWLQQYPEQRETIAKNGQKRCLQDHSIEKRALQLHQMILQKLE
ncbi:MAG: glycosyltransferase [Bacteroidales bacterium]